MTFQSFGIFTRKCLVSCLVVFVASPYLVLEGQQFDINSADSYKVKGPVQCQFQSHLQNDSLWIYAKLSFPNPPADSLSIQAIVVNSQGKIEEHDLNLNHALENIDDRYFLFKWGYEAGQYPHKLALKVYLKPRAWVFVESISINQDHPRAGLIVKEPLNNYPVLSNHKVVGDRLKISSPSTVNALYAYYYSHSFEPARAPMTIYAAKGSNNLAIDSVFKWPSDSILKLELPGLYFIQSDTNGIEGTSIFVGPSSFPKPRKIIQLTEPLVYITTKDEYLDIRQDLTNKKAFDKFWLSTVGSPQKARISIKNFYQLVESANLYFTSYKEGWKTDRGMIYIVMGPPNVVSKNKNQEVWSYNELGDLVYSFTFQKVSNIFSNNHYELMRNESLDRPWFVAIDRWRKGLIGF